MLKLCNTLALPIHPHGTDIRMISKNTCQDWKRRKLNSLGGQQDAVYGFKKWINIKRANNRSAMLKTKFHSTYLTRLITSQEWNSLGFQNYNALHTKKSLKTRNSSQKTFR